jgi:hypothetical protein
MTTTEIVANYLKQNGYDGLHSHPVNNKYGGCGCSVEILFGCQEYNGDCEPAYKHTKNECKKCPDYIKCEAYQNGERIMLCGKKKV